VVLIELTGTPPSWPATTLARPTPDGLTQAIHILP
jgi:hypothetical protein